MPVKDFDHRSPLVRRAYRYAAARHAGQVKDADGSPYLEHPVAVARIVDGAGYDEDVVAAALLHDVVEHAGADIGEIRDEFGDGVADLVAAMTEPEDIEPWERRKRAHRERIAAAGSRAGALFAADKAANVAALRRAIRGGGRPERIDRKLNHYRATLDMLRAEHVADPIATRLRDELDRLAAERDAARSHSRLPT
jgi:(p)ppGpp synthase/HD superfamily hydrolase